MPVPRLRQLRRDKTVFALTMNAIRLHVEEEDRLARQPHLSEAPDVELLHIQQSIDQWVGLATGYLMRKFKCSMVQAMQLLGELQGELKMSIPVAELRQVPYQQALNLPPELLAVQQAPAGQE